MENITAVRTPNPASAEISFSPNFANMDVIPAKIIERIENKIQFSIIIILSFVKFISLPKRKLYFFHEPCNHMLDQVIKNNR